MPLCVSKIEVAGYTAAQIAGFDDVAGLPSETMSSLLQQKAELAIANALGETLQKRKRRVKVLRGRKRKKWSFMPLETTSFIPVKERARMNLPQDNELRDAILTEPDMAPRIEINMKLAAYGNVLDAKVKRMRR
jgi:hypothetical protein